MMSSLRDVSGDYYTGARRVSIPFVWSHLGVGDVWGRDGRGTCGDDLFKFVAILLSYDNMVKNDFTSMVLEGVVPA